MEYLHEISGLLGEIFFVLTYSIIYYLGTVSRTLILYIVYVQFSYFQTTQDSLSTFCKFSVHKLQSVISPRNPCICYVESNIRYQIPLVSVFAVPTEKAMGCIHACCLLYVYVSINMSVCHLIYIFPFLKIDFFIHYIVIMVFLFCLDLHHFWLL